MAAIHPSFQFYLPKLMVCQCSRCIPVCLEYSSDLATRTMTPVLQTEANFMIASRFCAMELPPAQAPSGLTVTFGKCFTFLSDEKIHPPRWRNLNRVSYCKSATSGFSALLPFAISKILWSRLMSAVRAEIAASGHHAQCPVEAVLNSGR